MKKNNRMRQLIAQEAAKIMVEEGVQDFRLAKEKALRHLGADRVETGVLPSNTEINQEITFRLRMFNAETQPHTLKRKRQEALEALGLLQDFSPYIVGSVLEGTATEHSDINLHISADSPEEVAFFLYDHEIPYQFDAMRLRMGQGIQEFPVILFLQDSSTVNTVVFSHDEIRSVPYSKATGKPMRRARKKQLLSLLSESEESPETVHAHS